MLTSLEILQELSLNGTRGTFALHVVLFTYFVIGEMCTCMQLKLTGIKSVRIYSNALSQYKPPDATTAGPEMGWLERADRHTHQA